MPFLPPNQQRQSTECTFFGTQCFHNQSIIIVSYERHFHMSLSPVVPLYLGILHEWMRMQMLAKPPSNLLQRTGGDHWGGHAQPGWRTFMMTCLCWILGYMRLEIWCKIGLSGDRCLCTALHFISCLIICMPSKYTYLHICKAWRMLSAAVFLCW